MRISGSVWDLARDRRKRKLRQASPRLSENGVVAFGRRVHGIVE